MTRENKKKFIKVLLTTFNIILFLLILILLLKYFYNRKYHKIEKEYINAASYIYENNAIADGDRKDKIVITRKEINSLLTTIALENICDGYVIIYPSNQGPNYNAYINCKDYTTKGFEYSLLD